MSYSSQSFSNRFGMLGDMAEAAFEKFCIINDFMYERRGWDRPNLNRFYDIHPTARAEPDFVLETLKSLLYVDCKGTGQPFVKIKQESLDHLAHWNTWLPVYFFVWNSKTKMYGWLKYTATITMCETLPPKQFDNDKKIYYEVPVPRWQSLYTVGENDAV